MRLLLFAILLLPVLELASLSTLAAYIGWSGVIAWVVLAMLAGAALLRAQGLMALSDLRRGFTRPAQVGVLLRRRLWFTGAAVLLLIPGVVSDVAALGLALAASLRRPPRSPDPAAPRILEGEYRQIPPKHRP